MNLHIFTEQLGGLNFGIEFTSACMMLLLYVAMGMKKGQSKEIYYYKFFIGTNALAIWTDLVAYLTTGNKTLVPFMLTMSILSYMLTAGAIFGFYAYLQNHYSERYGLKFHERTLKYLFIYLIVICLGYISSAWTGWFYYVNENNKYANGPYASATGIMVFPLLVACFVIVVRNWKKASTRENVIHTTFILSQFVFGYLDAAYQTTIHYIANIVLAVLIYIVISLETEQQLAAKETELVKSELNALRLQMNPHFIYNTLASIDGLCMFDPEEARNLIAKFTKHLRSSYLD
ncbi:MAG: histidine kinase, partial [Lachnospiraceae bacterium]|nr:histidine kinase [Candidatus Equihabitans merdae]